MAYKSGARTALSAAGPRISADLRVFGQSVRIAAAVGQDAGVTLLVTPVQGGASEPLFRLDPASRSLSFDEAEINRFLGRLYRSRPLGRFAPLMGALTAVSTLGGFVVSTIFRFGQTLARRMLFSIWGMLLGTVGMYVVAAVFGAALWLLIYLLPIFAIVGAAGLRHRQQMKAARQQLIRAARRAALKLADHAAIAAAARAPAQAASPARTGSHATVTVAQPGPAVPN